MGIYTFSDAVSQLKKRVGNRNDITDADYAKYINQCQHVMATNVRGIDVFEKLVNSVFAPAGPSGYPITAPPPGGLGLTDLWAFQTILDLTDYTGRRRLYRGEAEMDFNLSYKPAAPPTLWFHKFEYLWFNTTIEKNRTLQMIYRRLPVRDQLEIPDDWFEHMLNLACTFVYPTIGRNKERDDLFAKLPQNLQLAVLSPMVPSTWEASYDQGLAVYSEW